MDLTGIFLLARLFVYSVFVPNGGDTPLLAHSALERFLPDPLEKMIEGCLWANGIILFALYQRRWAAMVLAPCASLLLLELLYQSPVNVELP